MDRAFYQSLYDDCTTVSKMTACFIQKLLMNFPLRNKHTHTHTHTKVRGVAQPG